MDSGTNKQLEPVCRFGPGGEFVSIWPGPSEFQLLSQNRLLKTLACLNEIIAGVLGSEFDQPSADIPKAHPAPAAGGQPTLFPDDNRIALQATHKPRHRLRAHRRTVKRPRIEPREQGMLFEPDIKIARIA
jgi:hypothetical protein